MKYKYIFYWHSVFRSWGSSVLKFFLSNQPQKCLYYTYLKNLFMQINGHCGNFELLKLDCFRSFSTFSIFLIIYSSQNVKVYGYLKFWVLHNCQAICNNEACKYSFLVFREAELQFAYKLYSCRKKRSSKKDLSISQNHYFFPSKSN